MTTPALVPASFAEAQDVLAAALPGYTRRAHQMALAERMEQAARNRQHMLAQAGTGTGKSLAYLITMILLARQDRERVVVSTFNKALQTQIALTDLPFLQEHLGVEFTWAVLKGRANYPCIAKATLISSPTPGQQVVLARLGELMKQQGEDREIADREDFPHLPEPEWRDFSMSSAECPGKASCSFGNQCISERAKERAANADIVVTNTAMLMQDLVLRHQTEGNVALLGQIDRLVIDEAHTLPEAATSALEDTIGEGTFAKLSRDMAGYMASEERSEELSLAIEPAAAALWEKLGGLYRDFTKKDPKKKDPMPLGMKDIVEDVAPLILALFRAIRSARAEMGARRASDDRQAMVRTRLMRRSGNMMDRLRAYATDDESKTIRWAEMETSVFRGQARERLYLCSAPLSVGGFLRSAMFEVAPTILISATLAAGKDFGYLAGQVGLDLNRKDEDGSDLAGDDPRRVVTYDAGSPFDYPRQAMLFTPPKGSPEPSGSSKAAWQTYAQAVTGYLVGESGGGALLLFTSRSAMNDAWAALSDQFRASGLTVLKQGELPNSELVRIMKQDGNAVLFALRTFFEGVDIQGSALRLVVLDKLPFSVPTDILHQARCAAIERRGDSPFDRLTIPQMVLILTQGFGRLIRHAGDKGVVAILDPRLGSKGYGRKILAALPPAARTEDPAAAAAFLRGIAR